MSRVLCSLTLLLLLMGTACQKEVSTDLSTPFLKTDSTSLTFPESAGKKDSFNIQSNIEWLITVSPSSASWLQLSIDSGNGNVKVYVTAITNNTSDTVQRATIIIAPVNNPSVQPVTILVTQGKPAVKARNAYGGLEADELNSAVATPDGGYIAVGTTASNNGDISGLHSVWEDVWIIKVDASGNKVWQKVLGGSGRDAGWCIIKTSDGNYIVTARADTHDGDLAGISGSGVWIIKLNGNGDVLWQKLIGGVNPHAAVLSIKPANGGGYVLTGIAVGDFWVAKIDEDANVIWQKLIGGMWADDAMDVVTASDGGYIVTGYSQSADRDVIGNHGSFDMVVFKVDENGNKVWLKCFGGTQDDYGYSLSKTNDGGYIVTGFTKSNDGDVTGNHGNTDMWVIKIDVNGNKVWQKTFGGSDREIANRIISTADGNFIIAGSTYSNDGDITGFHGYMDGCIVKLDGNGNKIWQKSLGGSDYDDVFSVLETSAGKYMAVGSTWSNDGDVVGYKGDSDGWLMKF